MFDEYKCTLRTSLASGLFIAVGFWVAAPAKGQPSEACPGTLFPNPEYCVPKRPQAVVTGDLNGDGHLDLAAALQVGPRSHTVAVLFGNGDGTFGDPVTYDGGFEPFDLAIGDLDGDGDLDILALDAGGVSLQGPLPGNFRVLLNTGGGNFVVHMIYGLGLGPKAVAIGDLDGDGDLDVAVAVTESNIVTTFSNNGDATFVFMANYPTTNPHGIAVGDLNGDGLGDFVTANWPDVIVSVRLNIGGGKFGDSIPYFAGGQSTSIDIGDLDGDGDADLAVANLGNIDDIGTTVSILQNNGDGIFSAPMSFTVGDLPRDVHMVDLDGDDDLDLVVPNIWDDNVSVLLNNGDATFADHTTTLAGSGSCAVASGDFDGDGDEDLTVANCFGDTLSVLPNLGDGIFEDVTSFDAGEAPTMVATGDLDGDGNLDLAVTNLGQHDSPGSVTLLFNHGDGSFPDQVVLDTSGYDPESLVIGDLDGDGDADVAAANYITSNVSVWLNKGNRQFADDETYETGAGPGSMAIGDLDGDGDLDLAVANTENGSVSILLNMGDATFADHVTYPVGGGGFAAPFAIVLGDVDGDGDLDFATANIKPFNVSIFLNNGDGTFGGEVTYPFFAPQTIAFGDLDGDDDLDLVTTNGLIWVSLNDGDGNFGDPASFESCFGAFFVTIADMDGDDDLDLVVKDGSNMVGVMLNDGAASFADALLFRAGTGPAKLAVADLNNDGALDVVVANRVSNDVSILLNSSANASGDLDDDCDVDLLDFAGFADCMSGPGGGVSVGCEPLDFESDGDVDMDDFHVFQRAFSGG